jgi:hypothetical protein
MDEPSRTAAVKLDMWGVVGYISVRTTAEGDSPRSGLVVGVVGIPAVRIRVFGFDFPRTESEPATRFLLSTGEEFQSV